MRSGYHINIAKRKQEVSLTRWEIEHGSGYQHYGTIECNNIDDPHVQFIDACKRYPVDKGFTLTLLYYPGIVETHLSTHIQQNEDTVPATHVDPNEIAPTHKVGTDGEVTWIETRRGYRRG